MNENLKKVWDVLDTDKTLLEKMGQCKTPEEAYEVAKTVADGYTLEEFKGLMTKIRDTYSNRQEGELNEEDLISVSGGAGDEELILGCGLGAAGILGLASMAAG